MSEAGHIILVLSMAAIAFLALSVRLLFVIQDLKLEIEKLHISLRYAKDQTND